MSSDPRHLPVEIIRSARRRSTVQARVVDGRLEVRIPAAMSDAEARAHASALAERIARRTRAGRVDLAERARRLARRYDLPEPDRIEWSERQMKRWGSCTPDRRHIRISSRLAEVPDWVLDHVILHELAHLIEPGHGPAFDAITRRYELSERAEGFLLGLSHPARRAEP